jgi:hypothetical protein
MKRSKLTLLTYHLTTTHYGKPQKNLKDQQLLYHRLENKTEAGHEQIKRKPTSSPITLQQTFTSNKNNNEDDVETFLKASCQVSLPTRAFTPTEVRNIINLLNPRKTPGCDLITGALLKKSLTKDHPTSDNYLQQHVATMLLSCTMEVRPNSYDSQARKTSNRN